MELTCRSRLIRCTIVAACLIVATIAAVAVVPADARAAPAGRMIAGDAYGPARANGRTLVYATADRRLAVAPVAGGSATMVDVSARCAGDAPLVADAGGGQALFECGASRTDAYFTVNAAPLLLDLSTHEIRTPAGAAELERQQAGDSMGGSNTFEAVGAQGLRIRYQAYHTDVVGVLDWRTGDVVEPVYDPPSVVDLDLPGIYRPLCAPLRRARAFEPPLALQVRAGDLVLRRCGSDREQVLAEDGSNPVLEEGFVSWWAGATRIVRMPGCRLVWPVAERAFAEHADGALVLSERFRDDGPWRIRVLPLDGACARIAAARVAELGGVRLVARRGAFVDPPSGGAARFRQHGGPPPVVRVGGGRAAPLELRLGAPAARVTWRLAGGRLHAAVGRAGRTAWRLRPPRGGRPRELTLRVRFRGGGSARYAVRLTGPQR